MTNELENLRERIRSQLGDQLGLALSNVGFLFSLHPNDLQKVHDYFREHGFRNTYDTTQFFSQEFDYLPRNNRGDPFYALLNIFTLSKVLDLDTTPLLEGLSSLIGGDRDLKPVDELLHSLADVFKSIDQHFKELGNALRNTKSLRNFSSATDLRAVYKEDISMYTIIDDYDPIIDLESFVPVGRIRLIFDQAGFDFIDFSCDLNTLNILIHNLVLTRDQMEALSQVGDAIRKEPNNDSK